MNPTMNKVTEGRLTDDIIAADLLSSVKSGIKLYASALSETTSPQVRTVLRKHLDQAISSHEKVSQYMINQGHYHPHDLNQQLKVDFENAQKVLNI